MDIRFKDAVKAMREHGAAIPECARLRILDHCWRADGRIRHYLQVRRDIHRACRELAEDGKLAVVWSGRDCDCVAYSGSVSIVDANWRAVVAHIDQAYEWADGPCYYGFERPSVAEDIEHESRDLALEAFEDGHPYSIHA